MHLRRRAHAPAGAYISVCDCNRHHQWIQQTALVDRFRSSDSPAHYSQEEVESVHPMTLEEVFQRVEVCVGNWLID